MPRRRRPATKPRKRPVQRRSRATVDALVTATARVLVRHGYDTASTNRIAKAAGVSVGSLYQYFPSKEALVAALIERHLESRRAMLRDQAVELAQAPLDVAVRRFIETLIAAQSQSPRLERVIVEQVPRVAGLDRLKAFDQEIVEMLTAYLGLHRRSIRRPDLRVAAEVLYLAVRGATVGAVLDPSPTLDVATLTEEMTLLVLCYLTGAAE